MTYEPHYLSVHSNSQVRGYIALLITGRFSPIPPPHHGAADIYKMLLPSRMAYKQDALPWPKLPSLLSLHINYVFLPSRRQVVLTAGSVYLR